MTDNDNASPTYTKPDIVLFYNSSKGGMDTADKYKEQYSISRISNRWSMTVFYSLLNIAGLNSFIILKQNTANPDMKRRKFLQTLAKDLCRENMLMRLNTKSTPTWTKKRVRQLLDVPEPQKRPPPDEEIAKGRCAFCEKPSFKNELLLM